MLEFDLQVSEQYNSTAHSPSEIRLRSENSGMSKKDKRSTVQKHFAKNSKRAAERCKVDREETRMALRYRVEIFSSIGACMLFNVKVLWHCMPLKIHSLRKVEGKIYLPRQHQRPHSFLQFGTNDSGSGESDTSETSKKQEDSTGSDVEENKVEESIDE